MYFSVIRIVFTYFTIFFLPTYVGGKLKHQTFTNPAHCSESYNYYFETLCSIQIKRIEKKYIQKLLDKCVAWSCVSAIMRFECWLPWLFFLFIHFLWCDDHFVLVIFLKQACLCIMLISIFHTSVWYGYGLNWKSFVVVVVVGCICIILFVAR